MKNFALGFLLGVMILLLAAYANQDFFSGFFVPKEGMAVLRDSRGNYLLVDPETGKDKTITYLLQTTGERPVH